MVCVGRRSRSRSQSPCHKSRLVVVDDTMNSQSDTHPELTDQDTVSVAAGKRRRSGRKSSYPSLLSAE